MAVSRSYPLKLPILVFVVALRKTGVEASPRTFIGRSLISDLGPYYSIAATAAGCRANRASGRELSRKLSALQFSAAKRCERGVSRLPMADAEPPPRFRQMPKWQPTVSRALSSETQSRRLPGGNRV